MYLHSNIGVSSKAVPIKSSHWVYKVGLKAITLDVGCTLIYESSCEGVKPSDTMVKGASALAEYLRSKGFNVTSEAILRSITLWSKIRTKYFSEYMEYSSILRMYYILKLLGITPSPTLVEEARRAFVKASIRARRLYDDVVDFLAWVKGLGIKIAAISNATSHEEVIETLKYFNILNYFDVVVTSNITIYKKPLREIFDITLELLSVKSSEVIHLGDSLADVDGALSAGYLRAIEVARHRECLTRYCVKSLKEAKELLMKFL